MGESFREIFLHLGEIRSLVSPHVRILAMTATISRSSRELVQNLVGMHAPQVIALSPCKENIYYSIQSCESITEVIMPLVETIQTLRTQSNRTITFCRTMDDCSSIHLFFQGTS